MKIESFDGRGSLCLFPYVPGGDEQLRSFRRNKIMVPPAYGQSPLEIDSIDWGMGHDKSPTFRWWLHSCKYLDAIIGSQEVRSEDLAKVILLLGDWGEKNSMQPYPSDYSWEEHASALRAQRIACAAWHLEHHNHSIPDVLKKLIDLHLNHLSDNKVFQGYWNHGLDQLVALFSLGVIKKDLKVMARSANLINEMFEMTVDGEGVCNEQSVDYQYYVYVLFMMAHFRLREFLPSSQLAETRLHSMLNFLVHATKPDGRFEPLGDTFNDTYAPKNTRSGELEYAATFGRSGSEPKDRIKIYGSGYIFGRTGWGTVRPFAQESYYTIRYGEGRRIHGHNDHTSFTYSSAGSPVIVDPGFSGYSKDWFRDYFRSPESHNVVYIPSGKRFLWDQKTDLIFSHIRKNYQSYVLYDAPYQKVGRRRSLIFMSNPEIVIIWDHLASSDNNLYRQALHFHPSVKLTAQSKGCLDFRYGSRTGFLANLWIPVDLYLLSGSNANGLDGGWYAVSRDRIEKTTTVISAKEGNSVGFLTVLCFGCGSREIKAVVKKQSTKKVAHVVALQGLDLLFNLEHSGKIFPTEGP